MNSPAAKIARERVLLFCLERLHRSLKHDWNGPFNSVGLNLSLLRRVFARGATEEFQARALEWIDSIEQETQSLHGHLQHFFALFSTAEEEAPQPIDPKQLWIQVESLITTTARKNKSVVESDIAPEAAWIQAPKSLTLLAIVALSLHALEPGGRLVWRMPSTGPEETVRWRLESPNPIKATPDLEAITTMLRVGGGTRSLQDRGNSYEISWPRHKESFH